MSPIVSPRPREGSRRPVLRVLDPSKGHESPIDGLDEGEPRRPALRIVPDGDHNVGHEHTSHDVAPVLLVGANADGRASLRAEFGTTLPSRTRWVEADDVAGALERAAHSRMAILAGDLDDADAESLMRLLGRRHPELPVICVDVPMPAAIGGRC